MAKPPSTYAEMVELARSLPIGDRVRGFRLVDRITIAANVHELTVSRSGDVWTVIFTPHPTDPGRVLGCYDEDGRQWAAAPWADDWIDGGLP